MRRFVLMLAAAALVTATVVATAGPAEARLGVNGYKWNGLNLNGFRINGAAGQDGALNGVQVQGVILPTR